MNKISRRQFVSSVSTAAALFPLSNLLTNKKLLFNPEIKKSKICIFSKHLQWLDYEAMGETAAELGFDGVDLTVRPGGHVLPENVEQNLPKAVDAVKKAGIQVPMMATGITDAKDPRTTIILKLASQLGIKFYRLGYYGYDESQPIPERLLEIQSKLKGLLELNKKYKICGDYQNHAGNNRYGAAIWDLWETMKNLDTEYIGCQFDVRHATVEGGNSWPVDFRLVAPFTHTIVVKDFFWKKNNGNWKAVSCPLGEGMVDFKHYFKLLKKSGFSGPITVHYEYPLGGANKGKTKITLPKKDVLLAMRKDLIKLKEWLKEADVI
jgi:sugar phosphate isomerase/epimerase